LGWADVVLALSFPAPLVVFPFCKKPVVWICNEAPETFYRWYKEPVFFLNRKVWRGKNKYLICSNEIDANAVRLIYRRKVDYILPFGVAWDFYSQGVKTPSDVFTILQVGYIGRYKDQLDTLEIFRRFYTEVPKSRLILVGPKVPAGSGPQYWARVEEKIKEYGLPVTMTGHQTREQVRDWLYRSDVFIHPVTGTGGWLAPFEALSAGLPVITSKRFFGKEFLGEWATVTDDYLGALLDVYSNRQEYNALAREASKWVKDNLTSIHYSTKMLGILREVVNANG
jgi:glycosyltransferase involved in cell wall biosynthesis